MKSRYDFKIVVNKIGGQFRAYRIGPMGPRGPVATAITSIEALEALMARAKYWPTQDFILTDRPR